MATKTQVDQLEKWARWTDRNGFIEAFGENFGCYLWDKFVEHDRNFLAFWNYLDNKTAQQVLDAVNKGINTGDEMTEFIINKAMKTIVLTQEYIGTKTLPAICGWEWYELAEYCLKNYPNVEWVKQYKSRKDSGQYDGGK